MARTIGKLTSTAVRHAAKPGLYGDGGGLALHVGPTGAKSWLFRFMLNGRSREMGLGPLHAIGLADARERARECRRLLVDGVDPLDARNAAKARRAAEAAGAITFKQAADAYVKAHRAAWKNAKHAWQWTATLESHVFPVIGALPVGAVGTGHVTKILDPIWASKAETASRVRGRIEAVLDFGKTHGWRDGENPARWKGHLENVLPPRRKVSTVEHHAALPWGEIGAFMAHLGQQSGTAALALRFAILTAARTGEALGAVWSEVDMRAGTWTIPGRRMKTGKEHRVPLSDAAAAVLREASKLRQDQSADAPLFPGGRAGKPLSNAAMLMLLRRMGRGDLTVHGFRSSFRDWCAEATNYPREVAEQALAHLIPDKVEAAYRRSDLLDRRRRLMAQWGEVCGRAAPAEGGAEVVALRA